MGKLSIARLALAMTFFGIFLLPPTDSFAANWLEKKLERLFSAPQDKAPKRRKPRAAQKVVTPLTAPVPAAKPDSVPPVDAELPQSSDVIPMPKDNPSAAAPVTKPAGPLQGPPMPQPKPELPTDSGPDDAGAMPENTDVVPIPEPNPRATSEDKPTQRPAGPVQGPPMPPALEASPQDLKPETVPIPEPNPRTATEQPDETAPAEETAPADALPEPMLPDPRTADRPDPSGVMPAEELACRERLTMLGVKFENHAAESDPAGCSIPYPLTVKSLGVDIGLQPEAEMNCSMAEAAARFMKDVVSPAAKAEFGQTLKSVSHASAYVCRPRNGTRKLSEHAFGNALDIASFTLSDARTIAVELTTVPEQVLFLGKVRHAACGPFKTVLGPGSNADHAEHLHFDLAPRRHGGTVCE